MAKGAAWSISARIVIRAIGLISTAILARLLVPEDFGLVALATVFIAGLEATTAFSFDVVLIANQQAGRRYYDTAFTLGLLRAALMALVVGLLASPASAFFDEPRLVEILYWLAFATFILGFENIALVDFRKHMNFGMDFAYLVGRKIGPFIVTVTLAFIWRDYWALVAGIVAGRFFEIAIGYMMRPYRPRLTLVKWRPVLSFSSWLMVRNLISFLHMRGDTFVIGKVVGAQALGVYSVAYEIASLATSELVTPVRRALMPGFSKLAADAGALRKSFLDSMALIWMVAMPMAAGIGLTADPLVRLFLGAKWIEAIPLLDPRGLRHAQRCFRQHRPDASGDKKTAAQRFAFGLGIRHGASATHYLDAGVRCRWRRVCGHGRCRGRRADRHRPKRMGDPCGSVANPFGGLADLGIDPGNGSGRPRRAVRAATGGGRGLRCSRSVPLRRRPARPRMSWRT